ncbi:gamma-glutamyltranspeptidase/glutathione hydrolase [Erythromicrobium ramosum]|uniref:Glutathione hydrolase proenzyme n=1 Tax=Erythrobacter ramosus TaxID=35811 RepID=A0A6I4UJP6_9SPHN|nr:gamma-glutamyltransferase [Erythrobacter ramosus]MBB3774533.1 gamma-glutamyltranspeptidase/glutathione hydrolase [Erythrobacter ramosus]MXP37817.1 gamma-glutamyltransferase [Erythrobacter ramosus]
MRIFPSLIAPLALALSGCATTLAIDDPLPAPTGAVSSADPRATAAGEAILAQGGSATDAAIAVMLALTVVEPQSSGIGGGGFMVRADGADGTLVTYDGRETAPSAATPNRFLDADGKVLGREARVFSGLSVGVPGNVALAAKAHAEHGKLPWAKLFAPAIALAEDGFVMNRRLYESLNGNKGRADKSAAAKAVFFGADGNPLPLGTTIRVPELAATFRALAAEGPQAMYGSTSAAALAAYVAGETPQDGRMAAADVTGYVAKERAPACARYRVYRVCGMGPPSSGGIAVAQMLGQLERFDIAALGPDSPQFWHLFIESQRLAYADRELYSGDADFVEVPVAGLVDAGYLASRSGLISPEARIAKPEAGVPPGAPLARGDGPEEPENGTTHFAVVDAAGNAVSYTSTIEGAFGSGLHWRGFYLNNELTDFTLTPEADGKPVANRVEGGKRPRSSMAPTIVYDAQGRVVLVIGAAGGPTIPVTVARAIIGVIDFKLGAQDALALPFAMSFGDVLLVEEGTTLAAMKEQLIALGHTNIRLGPAPIKANALGLRADGRWEAATEPRLVSVVTP